MDIEPFIREIIANPADDTARLIFADYLEEHGDPRAELIRAQYQLLGLERDSKEEKKLRKRERQLAKAHGTFGEVPKGVKPIAARAGFVDAIEVTVARFLKLQSQIFEMAPVRSVALKSRSVKFAQLAESPYLSHLRELQLLRNDAEPAAMASLIGSDHFTGLESLHVRSHRMDGSVINAIGNNGSLAALRTLVLNGFLNAATPNAIVESEHLRNLRELFVFVSPNTDSFLSTLASSGNFRRLEHLGLSGPFAGTGLARVIESENLSALHTLRFHSYESRIREMRRALQCPKSPLNLRHLKVHADCDLSVVQGILNLFPNLRILDLAHTRIGNDSAKAIAESPVFANLDKLLLAGNRIAMEGCVALAESPHRRKGTKIYLRRNQLNRGGVRRLKEDYGRSFGNLGDESIYRRWI